MDSNQAKDSEEIIELKLNNSFLLKELRESKRENEKLKRETIPSNAEHNVEINKMIQENAAVKVECAKLKDEKQELQVLKAEYEKAKDELVKQEKMQQYNCDQCDKEYHKKSSLVRHIKIAHEDGTKIPCEICDKRFTILGTVI